MKTYFRRFLLTNPKAGAVTVTARTFTEAFRKLQRTHAFFFFREGWKAQMQGVQP